MEEYPDVLHLTEVAKPVPTDDEVLVRVHTVSLNRLEWKTISLFNIHKLDWGST
jgi:NADPH:quinone reductase-like Zn-dependent oxidoreductase